MSGRKRLAYCTGKIGAVSAELDNGKGDRLAESSGVKVSVGWGKAQSDPPGRRANRQGVANGESGKPRPYQAPPRTETTTDIAFSFDVMDMFSLQL